MVPVHVVAALPTPQAVELSDAADAVHLAGMPRRRGVPRVPQSGCRSWIGRNSPPPRSFLTRTAPSSTAETSVGYEVQSIEKTDDTYAESELSDVKTIKPVDKFAPGGTQRRYRGCPARAVSSSSGTGIPRRISPVTGVYRDGKRIADGMTAPAFGDRACRPKQGSVPGERGRYSRQ